MILLSRFIIHNGKYYKTVVNEWRRFSNILYFEFIWFRQICYLHTKEYQVRSRVYTRVKLQLGSRRMSARANAIAVTTGA